MTSLLRRASRHRARLALVSAMLSTLFAGQSATAQEIRPGPLVDVSNTAKVNEAATSSEARSQQTQASEDAEILSFFRRTELVGFVDVYYGYNFNKPRTGLAQLRNFDVQHNAFSFNLAEVALINVPTADHRGGFRLDLDYGPTAAAVHAFEPGTTPIFQNIEQAYLSYLAPGKGLQLDIGKFVTQHGAEVIETKDNWNYSRSLLFALAIPYYHMGARITYPFSDKFTLGAAVVNGWNNVVDNNTGKTVGIQAVIKPVPAVTIVQNYMGGPEQAGNNDDWRHLADTTVTYNATSKVSLLANYDFGRDKVAGSTLQWQGVAGYLKIQPNAIFAFVPRFEWVDDTDGFMTGTSQKVKEVTLTGEVKHKDGVMMRVEYRRDFSDEFFFLKGATKIIKDQSTFTVGFVYVFSSKAP